MSSSLAYKGESENQNLENQNLFLYSQKDKSLGVLCTNFMRLYNRDGVESIELDDAASKLGVERRRMYDIVNIFEGVRKIPQYSMEGNRSSPQTRDLFRSENLLDLSLKISAKDDPHRLFQ